MKKLIALLALVLSLTGCVGYVQGPGVYGTVDVVTPVYVPPVVISPYPYQTYQYPNPYYRNYRGETIFNGGRGPHH